MMIDQKEEKRGVPFDDEKARLEEEGLNDGSAAVIADRGGSELMARRGRSKCRSWDRKRPLFQRKTERVRGLRRGSGYHSHLFLSNHLIRF